ncbi:uncharacterized protein LOC144419923 [Styela clava]
MSLHAPTKFEHSYSMLSILREMKTKMFICDFTIEIGDESFPAHRAVLAACSDYFVELFTDNPEQVKKGWYENEGLNVDSVRKCLEYMYTGEAYITMCNVKETLLAAHILKLRGLIANCVEFLGNNLSIGNCLQIKAIVKDLSLPSTFSMAEKFSVENCDVVIHTVGFQNLGIEDVANYMQNIGGYEKRWYAAISWINGDVQNKKTHLASMLKIVISVMKDGFDFLFTVMWKENLVQESLEGARIVIEACFCELNNSYITMSNCFEILELGHKYEDLCSIEKLNEVRDFMAANFNEVCKCRDFKRINYNDVCYILECSYIQCDSDEIKWKSATTWVKSSIKERKPLFRKMLKSLKLKKFGFMFFLNVILEDTLVKRSQQCTKFVLASLFSIMKVTDLNLSNWFYILERVKQYNGNVPEGILDQVIGFAAANFNEVSTSDSFVKIQHDDMKRLFGSPWVSQYSDEIQWQAVRKWITCDKESRADHLPDFLEELNIHTWSFPYLYTVVQNDILVGESRTTGGMVVSAYLYALTADDINIENCFSLLQTAKIHDTDRANVVIQKVYKFMEDNFEHVRAKQSFCGLEKEDIVVILQSPELEKWPEGLIWNSAMKWLKADIENRQASLSELLQVLKLKNYSFTFLYNYVNKEPLVSQSHIQECVDEVTKSLFSALSYSDIDVENWFSLFQLAKKYNQLCSADTMDFLKDFMVTNFEKINKEELKKDEFMGLITSPVISGKSELKWTSIMQWIKSSVIERKRFLPEMISTLNPHTLPFKLLYEAENENLVRESQICYEMIVSCLLSVTELSNIDLINWPHLLEVTRKHANLGPTNIVQHLRQYMIANFGVIYRHKAFMNLDQEDIVYLFSSHDVNATEEMKATAALEWVRANAAERTTVLPTLFNLVQLSSLDREFLKKIHGDNLVSTSCECKDLILKALLE